MISFNRFFNRFAIAVVVSLIVMTSLTASAQAQWGFLNNSPQRRVENAFFRVNHAGELRLIRLLFNQAHELYGYYARGPHGPRTFYPVLDRNCKPLSKRQRWERGLGLTLAGTAIGGIVDGWKGAGIGTAGAAAGALINDSRYCSPEQQEEVYYSGDPLPEREGMARRPTGGTFDYPLEFEQKILQNNFERVRVRVNVVVKGTVVNTIILEPGERLDNVQIPRGAKVWGEAEIEVNGQLTWNSNIKTEEFPYRSGWKFSNPYSKNARY